MKLLTGSSVALLATYLARPVLTRLFDPTSFGLLGFFVALVAVLGTISTARYEDAVMLPEKDSDARSVFFVGLIAVVIITLSSAMIPLVADQVADVTGDPEVARYLPLVPVVVLFAGLARMAEAWLTRISRFGEIALTRVVRAVSTVTAQLGSAVRGFGAAGLVGGWVVGTGIAAVLGMGLAGKRLLALPSNAAASPSLAAAASRYRRFPVYSGPASLMNSASSQLPALLLFFFFEAAVVGEYTQAYALLAIPIGLVSGSVGQVFFRRAPEARRNGTLPGLARDLFGRLVGLGTYPLLLVVVAGPPLFTFILGSEWTLAGEYARWLAVWLLFVLASSPLSKLFDVLERQRANLYFNVGLFLVRTIALVVGGLAGDALLAVALFGLSGAILWIVHAFWMLNLADVGALDGLKSILVAVGVATVPLAAVGFAAAAAGVETVFAVSLAGAVVYYGVMLKLQPV